MQQILSILAAIVISVAVAGCASLETTKKVRELTHKALDMGFDAALMGDALYRDGKGLYEGVKCMVVACPPPVKMQ